MLTFQSQHDILLKLSKSQQNISKEIKKLLTKLLKDDILLKSLKNERSTDLLLENWTKQPVCQESQHALEEQQELLNQIVSNKLR